MHQRGLGWLILIMLLPVPVELLGQEPGDKVASPYQRAVRELEGVMAEAESLETSSYALRFEPRRRAYFGCEILIGRG